MADGNIKKDACLTTCLHNACRIIYAKADQGVGAQCLNLRTKQRGRPHNVKRTLRCSSRDLTMEIHSLQNRDGDSEVAH